MQASWEKSEDLGQKTEKCKAMFANRGVIGQQMPTTSHNFNGFFFSQLLKTITNYCDGQFMFSTDAIFLTQKT